MHEAHEEAVALTHLWCRTLQGLPDEKAAVGGLISSTYSGLHLGASRKHGPNGASGEEWYVCSTGRCGEPRSTKILSFVPKPPVSFLLHSNLVTHAA